MFIIHRYVLLLFLKVLLISFISLAGLYVVIDGLGNLEEFLGYGESEGSLLRVLGDYYAARVLTFFDRTSGLLTLTAAVFAITWLRRTNELTALMAAGISPARVVRPLVIAAVGVSLLAAVNREWVIPRYRDKLSRNAQDWLGKTERPLNPRYDSQTDILLGGRTTVRSERRIDQPRFALPTALRRHYGRNLTAGRARYYREPADGIPGGYLLDQVTSPDNLNQLPSTPLGDRLVILTPADTDWLKPNQCFVVSDVDFEQLSAGKSWRQFASVSELLVALKNPSLEYGPDLRVSIHTRLVKPLMDLTLLFLGIPLVLSHENRNIFLAAAMCLGVVAVFMLVTMACQALGNHGYLLTPAQAAWGPLLLFAPIAIAVSQPLWE